MQHLQRAADIHNWEQVYNTGHPENGYMSPNSPLSDTVSISIFSKAERALTYPPPNRCSRALPLTVYVISTLGPCRPSGRSQSLTPDPRERELSARSPSSSQSPAAAPHPALPFPTLKGTGCSEFLYVSFSCLSQPKLLNPKAHLYSHYYFSDIIDPHYKGLGTPT